MTHKTVNDVYDMIEYIINKVKPSINIKYINSNIIVIKYVQIICHAGQLLLSFIIR